MKYLIRKLADTHSLTETEYRLLIEQPVPELAARLAVAARQAVYGNAVYIRGLIEISSYCRNDCLYCGLRRSNENCQRYRLTDAEILSCCAEGYGLGFRTFVLQGGEDGQFSDDRLCPLIQEIKARYPDCAVTLSLGERSRESYQALYDAGADRYLLRHETADQGHYRRLHPEGQSWRRRMECLQDLKAIGYQTGCGFMVGSPGQTPEMLAKELKFIEEFQPEMCGIGPFLPHSHTPFAGEAPGNVALTCYLLSLIRLVRPSILLPATTALGTAAPMGREKGILAGANVVMPNLSPTAVRKKYMLYDDKLSDGPESAQSLQALKERMAAIGYQIVAHRGDHPQGGPHEL